MEYDLHKNIGFTGVCTEFDMFDVKVPIIFSGTQGFPARTDARY